MTKTDPQDCTYFNAPSAPTEDERVSAAYDAGWQAALAHERARATSPAQQVPDGWKLVPVVATPDMVEAGWIDKEDVSPGEIYAAMLAAAPVASHELASVSDKPGCVSSVGDNEIRCPICAKPFRAGETCATDITEGTCHAACLDGSPAVDLTTGEPLEGPVGTFPWESDPASPPEPAKAEVVAVKPLEWKKRSSAFDDDLKVDTVVGRYDVGLVHVDYTAIHRSVYRGDVRDTVLVRNVGLEAAKAAAQADYECRILSAIATLPTAPAAARSAAEEMRERCAKVAEGRANTTVDDAVYMEMTQVAEDILAISLPGEEA